MPIHLSWDDADKTIILVESAGRWTWEDYHQALGRIIELVRAENHRVDLITFSQANAVRPPGSALPHYQNAMRSLPGNTGLNVILNTSAIARAIVSVFLRLYGSRTSGMVVLVGSLEEARLLINKDRAKSLSASDKTRSG